MGWPSRELHCLLQPWQRQEVYGSLRAFLVTKTQGGLSKMLWDEPPTPFRRRNRGEKGSANAVLVNQLLDMLRVTSLNFAPSLDFWSQMDEILDLHLSHSAAVHGKGFEFLKPTRAVKLSDRVCVSLLGNCSSLDGWGEKGFKKRERKREVVLRKEEAWSRLEGMPGFRRHHR